MPINRAYAGIAELPTTVPVFPLPGVLLLPRGELPLNIFEPRYLAMIDDALRSDRLIGMIQPAIAAPQRGPRPKLEEFGCLGRITQFAETGDGRYVLGLTGVARFRIIEELVTVSPYRRCQIDVAPFAHDLAPDVGASAIDRASVIQAFREFARARELQVDWQGVEAAPTEDLVNMLSMMSPFDPAEKQTLIEAIDLQARARALISIADPASAPKTLH